MFCTLPRALREEILLYLKEISRIRVVCKCLKDAVDKSERMDMVKIKKRRALFEEKKRKEKEKRRELEKIREEQVKQRIASR